MTALMYSELLGVAITLLLIFGLGYPLGIYINNVYRGQPTWLDFLAPVENAIYKAASIKPQEEYSWWTNMKSLLWLNAIFFVWAMVILLNQSKLPLNPDNIPDMEWTQAFNTAVSFLTNTNLQHYSGETGVSYFSQLMVMCYLQFVSAATGMGAMVLLWNAINRNKTKLIGNFYVFFLKSATRILLPLAVLVALFLVSQGTPMVFHGALKITTLEGAVQQIATGPIAAMVAIKQIGTNGGGFFGPNSTHPLENPNGLTNIIECFSILLIPVAMVWAFGFYTNRRKLSQVIFYVMLAGFMLLLLPTIFLEMNGSKAIDNLGMVQHYGSMEGKETRNGAGSSALWGVSATATSNGSANAMYDSFTPLSGAFLMLGMMVNAFFGGVGVGFLNMFIFMILAVFIAGLMVGRTPEILGKKLEPQEIKVAALVFLLHPFLILTGTAIASWHVTNNPDVGWLNNPSFHGFSEMLYEFTSASANNGSGFEGLIDNTPFWNLSTGIVMLIARYLPIIGPVAIAGWIAAKPSIPESSGTLKLDNSAFGTLLFAIILVLSALAFFPALALGPLAEFFSN